jgi:dipeptidyl aminopeptidase/acylaminoacyl peptidase
MLLSEVVFQTKRHGATLVLCSTLLLAASAQQLTPLPVGDVLAARSFAQYSPIQFSPDGKWLAYTVREDRQSELATAKDFLRAGVPPVAKATDIYLVETNTGVEFSVAGGIGENWLPVWSPDGRYLAFLSNRDASGLAKLWIWEIASGTLRKVSDVNVRANQLEWLPDSRAVLIGVLPEQLTPAEFAVSLTEPMKVRDTQSGSPAAAVEIYRSPTPLEGGKDEPESPPWSLDYAKCDLAVIDVTSGHVQRVDRGHRISAYFLSPDGLRVAYTSPQSFLKPGSQQILFSVSLISLSSGGLRTVAHAVPLDFGGTSLSWSPSGLIFAYRTGGMEGKGDCYVVNATSGVAKNVSSFAERHAGYASSPPLWDAKGRDVFFTDGDTLWKAAPTASEATRVAKIPGHVIIRLIGNGTGTLWSQDGGDSTIVPAFDRASKQLAFYRVYLDSSRLEPLLRIEQSPAALELDLFGAVSVDGMRFAYFSQDSRHDMDLWLTNPSFTSPRRLTHLNPQFDRHELGNARLVEWLSLDGELLQGALLLPAGYQPGTHYPLIVWVYGGDLGSDYLGQFGLLGGPFNLQLFATRGYAVLFPDVPQHLGTPMADLAKAVLPGVNKVIEMGIADENRLGVIGHSYGGYSVLSLLVQTRRFKAAVMEDGTGDLISSYGQMGSDGTAFGISGAEGGQELMGGPPWEFRDRYIENSPVFYFDRVVTPLLIVHGTEDISVAPFLGDEVFVNLRRLGKRVEYAKYQGQGHSLADWSRADQSDLWERVLTWFHTYLTEASDATQ